MTMYVVVTREMAPDTIANTGIGWTILWQGTQPTNVYHWLTHFARLHEIEAFAYKVTYKTTPIEGEYPKPMPHWIPLGVARSDGHTFTVEYGYSVPGEDSQ